MHRVQLTINHNYSTHNIAPHSTKRISKCVAILLFLPVLRQKENSDNMAPQEKGKQIHFLSNKEKV